MRITNKHFEKYYGPQWAYLNRVLNNEFIPIESGKVYRAASNVQVNVAIPTLGLREQIVDSIDTFLTSTYRNTSIVVLVQENDAILKRLDELYGKEPQVVVMFEPKRLGWVNGINTIAKREGHLFATGDDVCVTRDTVEILVAEMYRLFPDGDGVLANNHTMTQKVVRHKIGWMAAFPFIGNGFINRFPDRQVLCPDYVSYSADVELPDFAISIDKLRMIRDAHVLHFERRTMDNDPTSKIVREKGLPDIETYFIRQQRGHLWGRDFELIGVHQ